MFATRFPLQATVWLAPAGKERRQREREDAEDPNESIARFLEGFSASRGEIEASIRNLQAEEQLSGAAAARARCGRE